MEDDIITQVNPETHKVFDQLRSELASFAPVEKDEVEVERRQFSEPSESRWR